MAFVKFDKLCMKFEVPNVQNQHSPFFNLPGKVRGLTQLPGGLHVHIVADDSGSMSNQDKGETQPRYLEQRDRLTHLAEWALSLNIPVYFSTLNGVHKMVQLDPENGHEFVHKTLSELEYGYTPLYDTLKPIFDSGKDTGVTKLILVGTDGGPTASNGLPAEQQFKNLVMYERDADHNHIAFIACVGGDIKDPKHPLHYINELDSAPYVDCFDDFNSEKQEICEDYRNQYTSGLHALRIFASTFYKELDNLDGK